MANTLTPANRAQAEAIFERMAAAQTQLWDLSHELEKLIGCAVDTTEDLLGVDVDYFINEDSPV